MYSIRGKCVHPTEDCFVDEWLGKYLFTSKLINCRVTMLRVVCLVTVTDPVI